MLKVDKIAIEIKHIIEDKNGNYLRRKDRYFGISYKLTKLSRQKEDLYFFPGIIQSF